MTYSNLLFNLGWSKGNAVMGNHRTLTESADDKLRAGTFRVQCSDLVDTVQTSRKSNAIDAREIWIVFDTHTIPLPRLTRAQLVQYRLAKHESYAAIGRGFHGPPGPD